MRDLLLLAVQLVITLARVVRPVSDHNRFVHGLISLFVRPRRVAKLPVVLKPATLLRFHKALVDRKCRRLFSSAGIRRTPGPKGTPKDVVAAIIEVKVCNPCFYGQRIAEQISQAFGTVIDEDVARRVLAKHYRAGSPEPSGLSWLAFFAQAKDTLPKLRALSDWAEQLPQVRAAPCGEGTVRAASR